MNHQKWNDFRFDIGPYTNCSSAMKTAIVEFGKTVLKKLIGKNTVLFMFKIQTEEEGFKSITHLQEFHWNKTPKDAAAFEGNEVEFEKLVWDERDQSIQTLVDLLTLCEESWEMHSDRYQNVYINYIVFSYKIIPSSEVQQITKKSKLENKFKKPIDTIVNKEEPQIYSGHYLPTTMDFTKWGDFEIASDFKSAIVKKILVQVKVLK